eukprot:jgi/Mesvir1/12432/Mv26525-RA.1
MFGIAHSTWRTYMAVAKAACKLDHEVWEADTLDAVGCEIPGISHGAGKREPSVVQQRKEWAVDWIAAYVQTNGCRDPTRDNVLLLEKENLKNLWEQQYCMDCIAVWGNPTESKMMYKYTAFTILWNDVCEGKYSDGLKIEMQKNRRNVGICGHCVLYRTLRAAAGTNREQLERITLERNRHLAAVRVARREFWKRRREGVDWQIISLACDKIDSNKSYVPHMCAKHEGWENGINTLFRFSLFCVAAHGWKTCFFQVLPWVAVADQSGGITVTLLMWVLCELIKAKPWEGKGLPMPDTLHLQLDGGSENRNDTVLLWAWWLVASGLFARVEIHRLPRGHTHLDIDQKFGQVWGYFKLGANALKGAVWHTVEEYGEAVVAAFRRSDTSDLGRTTPAGTVCWTMGAAYNIAAWLMLLKEPELANWAMSTDWVENPLTGEAEKNTKSCKVHHLMLRRAADGEVYLWYKFHDLLEWRPDGADGEHPLWTREHDGKELYGVLVVDGEKVERALGTVPSLAGLDLDFLEGKMPGIQRKIKGLMAGGYAQYLKKEGMDKWEAFWPLVPTGVATVPAEWQPPKWPTRAEIQALRRPNQSGAGPSATTDLDAETRLALEGARCFVPLVDPVVHAGRPAAVRRAEDAAVALKQASAAAWEGIEVGKPVMCQHPGLKDGCDLLCSPLMPFTPLLYAVARNITGDLSPDAVVELECYGSHSYTTRFSPFSPSSAHFPLPAATRTGTHTFSVKASTIVLSSWRAGGARCAGWA